MSITYSSQGLYQNGYCYGHVDLATHGYNTEYKDLDYVRQPIKQTEIDAWQKLGYTHQNWSGKMRDSRQNMPDWVLSLGKAFYGLENHKCGYVLYVMNTGEIMPQHVDHYETYSRVFSVNRNNILRTVIFLGNWKPGHYFDCGGTTCVPWSAGDFCQWTADTPHSASNIGVESRWTLQITGALSGRRSEV